MGRWVRRGALGLVLLVAFAWVAAPARAGGPTSVLLSAPSVPKVVAAGYEDPRYEDLMRLVDPTATRSEPMAGDHATGSFIRAAWLIHDMQVWKLDIIYPDAPGGPWIATTQDQTGSGDLSGEPVWHRSSDPVKLLQLLGSMGLLANGRGYSGGPTSLPGTGAGNGTGTTDGTVVAGSNGTDDAGTAVADQSTDQRAASLSGWRWMIPGFLLGAVIAVIGTRLWLPRRGRWELIDVE